MDLDRLRQQTGIVQTGDPDALGDLLAECAEEQRHGRVEHWVTEGGQTVVSFGAGYLAGTSAGGVEFGRAVNYIVGVPAKILAIMNPEGRGLRVTAQVFKEMFHAQLSVNGYTRAKKCGCSKTSTTTED